ncbi:MAG: GGDEF domain-containing protein, partial [Clostridium sp.]
IITAIQSICLIFYYITHLNQNLRRDTLTGMFNRHMYDRHLNRFNRKHSVTIINIDVNNFKDINDHSVHCYGDEVLKKTSELLQKHFDPYGYTYRISGDEFCVILDKKLPVAIASAFISLEEELIPEKKRMGVTKLLSYGYFFYNHEKEMDIYAAVKEADNYMYNYKNRYKNKLINM